MLLTRRLTLIVALSACFASWGAAAAGMTLKEAAQEAALHNPEVLSTWHAYREASENIDVAEGGYRPKVDVSAGITRERSPGIPWHNQASTSIYLNQMLYDGFATKSEVERLSYAQRVRYYEMLDKTEEIALETQRAFNDVIRYRKLFALAEENYVQHRAVYEQISRRVKAKIGKLVDLEQASGRLALAESNLLTETSNLHDVSARFQRIVGKMPPAELVEPELLKKSIPATKAEAVLTGYRFNPTILAAQENIVSTIAERRGVDSKFKPQIYFQMRKDLGWNVDNDDSRTTSDSLGVLLNYNIYNGGADTAQRRQYSERINVARDLRDKVCRDIRQSVSIAHNDLKKLAEQLEYLDAHQLSTEKARDAYRKQFDIGQRSLLDLLDTENELFEARRAYVGALHDQAYAHARTQAGMGKLLEVIGLQHLEAENLAKQNEVAEFDPMTICPVDGELAQAIDKDKIFADALAANPELLPPETPPDSDADGVTDDRDKCPGTPAGTKVTEDGCPVPVAETEAKNVPVNVAGNVTILKGVNFDLNSAVLRNDAHAMLNDALAALKADPSMKVEVGGHTCDLNTDEYNLDLSERRAKAVKDYFIAKGVPAEQLTSKGYGEAQPLVTNVDEPSRMQNRRVELRVVK